MTKNFIKTLFLLIIPATLYSQSLEKVSLQLNWKNQFEFAGFYVAKEKGFYKDLGLDVTIKEYKSNVNIIDELINKKSEYIISYSNFLKEEATKNSLVFVANFFKQSPIILITQENIKSPKDLIGKKIMGANHPNLGTSVIHSMLKKFGIKKESYTNVTHTYNLDDFINKKVDAMVVFNTNDTFYLDKQNIKYHVINPMKYGSRFYDSNLITTKDELNKYPNRVKAIKKASIKGWKYALKNKDEVIDLILKKYNTQNKSKEALKYEALKIEHYMHTYLFDIGSIDKRKVENMLSEYKKLGEISDVNINLDSLIYKEK